MLRVFITNMFRVETVWHIIKIVESFLSKDFDIAQRKILHPASELLVSAQPSL